MIVYGKNPFLEALKTDNISKAYIKESDEYKNTLKKNKIPFTVLKNAEFNEKFGFEAQGVAFESNLQFKDEYEIDTDVSSLKIVVLDHIQDPQNFGAIIRAGHCFGINHFVAAKNNQVSITPAVVKASAGSIFHVNLYLAVNLARLLERLKKENFFVYAADVNASLALKNVSFAEKSVVILGSEGKGIRPNVLKRADERFYIPMYGKIDSLNVSQSATLIFYHMHFF